MKKIFLVIILLNLVPSHTASSFQIEHKKIDSKKLYIVNEGRYPSSKIADKASKKIKKALKNDSIVKQHN